MKRIRQIAFCICSLLVLATCYAQEKINIHEKPEMAVSMRANGKIYVVVAVVVMILLGLFFYLINLDKNIRRLENKPEAKPVDTVNRIGTTGIKEIRKNVSN